MKTWGVVCGLLSGAIFAVMIASMNSCGDSYEISPEGRLCVVKTDPSTNPPTVTRAPRDWASELPQFLALEKWVRPGDRIESSRITAGLWLFEVQMRKVEVFRGTESVMLARDGHVRFWGMIVALSLFPMICWAIGGFWIVTLSPRRGRETGS